MKQKQRRIINIKRSCKKHQLWCGYEQRVFGSAVMRLTSHTTWPRCAKWITVFSNTGIVVVGGRDTKCSNSDIINNQIRVISLNSLQLRLVSLPVFLFVDLFGT